MAKNDDPHEKREVAKIRVKRQNPSETNYSADGAAEYEFLEVRRRKEREREARNRGELS